MHQFKCKSCEHVFEEIVDHGENQSVDDDFECPECGVSDSNWIPSVRIDRWSEQFPYFDRGLGVMLQSKEHRRKICKEKGLTPVDGDYDADDIFDKLNSKRDAEEREYRKYCDRLDTDPAFSAYRKARDQGRL